MNTYNNFRYSVRHQHSHVDIPITVKCAYVEESRDSYGWKQKASR